MAESISFGQALLVVALFLMGGQAVHWLMTPLQHADASILRTVAVVVQMLVGFGGAMWAARKPRQPRENR